MSDTNDAETPPRIFRFTTHPEDTPTGTCDVCYSLDGVEIEERLIGDAFQNAEQTDENSYDAHVHKTCACTLEMVEDNQVSPEPEMPETQPNMFTYWQNKDTKREDVNTSETPSTPNKFAYWRDTSEKTETEKTPPQPKSGNVPEKTKNQPKPAPKQERSEEIKPPEQQHDETAKSSEQEPVKLQEGPKQDLEIAQRAPPEKLALNKQALSKLVYWPSKGAKSKKEPPTEAPSNTEEIKPSKPDNAARQPEIVTTQLNQPAPASTQVNHKLAERQDAQAQPKTTPLLANQQKSTEEIPLKTNSAPLAYWSTQPTPRPSTESLNTPEVNLQQQPQLYGLPAPQQPLALPEPATTETPALSQPQPSARKTPVQYFSYWTQGQMPDAELKAQLPQMPPEHEEAKQHDYSAQRTYDVETLHETFAESKVSEEVAKRVAPKVAHKLAKLAYWNPPDSTNVNAEEDPSQDASPDEEPDQDETSPASIPEMLHLAPRRILHAARSIRGFENLGLHAISGAGAINPATAALATTLIPLITELVRVEVELQLQAHNKQMEKERNAEYRSAYASVTPL